jgi:endonuclease YncB( thermonuclease family)
MAFVLATVGTARADDLIGQATVIDGDTLEIHGNRIRLWGIDGPRAPSSAGTRTVINTAAAPKLLTSLTPSSRGGR